MALLLAVTLLTGFQIGAGVYETRVVLPLWASDPPRSVRAFFTSPSPPVPARFWMFSTPAFGLACIALLVASITSAAANRSEVIVASALLVALVGSAFAYFVPRLFRLRDQSTTLADDEVVRITHSWVRLNLVRIGLFLVAWGLLIHSVLQAHPSP
jgi:hypothetical protein